MSKDICQTPSKLTAKEFARYERHIELAEIGEQGQSKLLSKRALVIGAGGLGSPVAAYLAGAGIGIIGIVDDDYIRVSNLQRQLFFRDSDTGTAKAPALEKNLRSINPTIDLRAHQVRLRPENIDSIFSDYDIILDGTDNFDTRFLVNDTCHSLRKPLISGSVLNFDGQITTFKSYLPSMPCYRCLYPTPPPAGLVPTCSESAVFGPMVGTIGCMMAGEAIKELLGYGNIAGYLIIYSALSASMEKIKLDKRTDCMCKYP